MTEQPRQEAAAPVRILVTQVTRMGDMLQTTPLIRGLRRAYPGAQIAVIVRDLGRAVAERVPEVDEILIYNEEETLRDLRSGDSMRLLRAYRQTEAQLETIRARRFDTAYNCTNSIGSAMFLKLAGIPRVIGAHLSDDWQFVLRGPWTNYFFTCVFHRAYNALNMCDIVGRFVDGPACRELVFDLTADDRAAARELLARHGIGEQTPLICFQLGASDEKKRWAPEHFAALARLLKKEGEGPAILLLGVTGEEDLGKVFEDHAPGLAIPLFGKTTLPQAAALLERAQALVTNDTGTMHLAAAVGCRVVLTSVGYVHFRETGPYGPYHCAVEMRRPALVHWDASSPASRNLHMQPGQVLRAMELTLRDVSEFPIEQVEEDGCLQGVDLYTSRFAPDGFLEWYPLVRRALTETDLLRIAYRAMWIEWLEGRLNARGEEAALGEMLRCFAPAPDEALATWRERFTGMFAELARMARQGLERARRLSAHIEAGGSMREARDRVAELMALDEQMQLYGEVHEPCRPITLIARYERDNLEGGDPALLAKTTADIYAALEGRALLMAAKIALVCDRARTC